MDPDRLLARPASSTAAAWDALLWGAGFAGLFAIAFVLTSRKVGQFPDDAYIFFRYARNLAEGHGWAFNIGDTSSNGATSPLWTLILSSAYLVRSDMESNARVLYCLFLSGAALLTFAGMRRSGHPAAGVGAALLLVVNPVLLLVCGMESALFLCLAAGLLLAGVYGRSDWPVGLLGGLLVLARPEGVVLVALVLGVRWWTTRRIPWVAGLLTTLVLFPWVLYSTITFGSPVAGTLAAKTAQGESGYWGPPFLFIRYLGTMVHQPWSLLMLALAVPGTVVGLRQRDSRHYTAVAVLFAGLHFLLYGLLVRPPAYVWYYAVTYWVLSMLACVGVVWLVNFVSQAVARFAPVATRKVVRLTGVAAVLLVLVLVTATDQARRIDYGGYVAASEWLRDNSSADERVAATEIGVLGWVSDRPVVDYLGLLSPESAAELATGDLSTWLDREEPDFYIQHVPVWDMERPSTDVEWFSRAYTPVFESTAAGWSTVRVFKKVRTRDGALSSDQVVLVSPWLKAQLAAVGADLDERSSNALGILLQEFLVNPELQGRFQRQDGVDITGLLRWSLENDYSGSKVDRRKLADLLDQVGAKNLVTPLAG